jgi:hypothetical protein
VGVAGELRKKGVEILFVFLLKCLFLQVDYFIISIYIHLNFGQYERDV